MAETVSLLTYFAGGELEKNGHGKMSDFGVKSKDCRLLINFYKHSKVLGTVSIHNYILLYNNNYIFLCYSLKYNI